MSQHTDLIRAVLREKCPSHDDALCVLETALSLEQDPLDYCAITLGVGQAPTLERCANWAGLAHFDVVPRQMQGNYAPVRLEALADVRAFKIRLLDRDVLFCAPQFFELARLQLLVQAQPKLARRLCLVPANALRRFLVEASAEHLLTEARQGLARHWPMASANLELTTPARLTFVAGLFATVTLVLISSFFQSAVLFPVVALLLALPAAIRLASVLTYRKPALAHPEQRPPDEELPVYSVLIPLRDEAHMVPQLVAAMLALDYPHARLDIKFVVEARGRDTVDAIQPVLDRPQFTLIEVPHAAPLTKPKALDYALPLARGEFVVVFDAEDTPSPDQLWRTALLFRDNPDVHCIQAELIVDNAAESPLTSLFAGEYAGLFGVQLPALARWRLPIPLGGTSNHFRLSSLRRLGGWDPYNVTEDADLGVRLARSRHRVETLAVGTLEESPPNCTPGWPSGPDG
ncbi:glycosyltransferase [Devosia rhodophyticola]|uniref:Glycosyltransferase n=1 Tax=Devosia rhodophyticola TaxID=3026423 RepID=A0ABY7Z0H6_9HYPH|nr:glycosyltransferase [Devosia rhodophyticola]WDR07006.1 glycosyltransferase [Devosia rhodophyticola]